LQFIYSRSDQYYWTEETLQFTTVWKEKLHTHSLVIPHHSLFTNHKSNSLSLSLLCLTHICCFHLLSQLVPIYRQNLAKYLKLNFKYELKLVVWCHNCTSLTCHCLHLTSESYNPFLNIDGPRIFYSMKTKQQPTWKI
jgi:hypothetical protein